MQKSDLLFEKLGYNRVNKLNYYKDRDDYTRRFIIFSNDYNNFMVFYEDILTHEHIPTFVSKNELEAISQKFEELRKEK